MRTIAFLTFVALFLCINAKIIKQPPLFHTVVTTRNITGEYNPSGDENSTVLEQHKGTYIDVQIVDKPHNLFIGRCLPEYEELHNENIILNNDGKSHVTAEVQFNVNLPVEIKCVKVLDQKPGSGSYPTYLRGGVGHNYVDIGVTTKYGQGFNFFVQILGFTKKSQS